MQCIQRVVHVADVGWIGETMTSTVDTRLVVDRCPHNNIVDPSRDGPTHHKGQPMRPRVTKSSEYSKAVFVVR